MQKWFPRRRGRAPDPPDPPTAGRGQARPSWRRTLAVVWIVEFVAMIGFSMVIPFLPLFVQEMGVTDDAQVKLWSGLLLGGQALTMGLIAPVWGSMADRYGRKLMLLRATLGATVVMTLMGFAQTPLQLLILRVIQGVLTGTVPAATTLIASVVPRERTGFALGLLQTGMFAGVSIGPLLGGIVADTLGYRYSFFLTGGCLLVAALGVFLWVHEDFTPVEPRAGGPRPPWWHGLAEVVRDRGPLIALLVRFLARTGMRVIEPILPLFVFTLMPPDSVVGVATMTGLVTGANAIASSLGAVVLGRMGDRAGYQRILFFSVLAGGIIYLVQGAVSNTMQLIILQFALGVAMAGTVSTLAALLARLVPEGRQGAIYGLDTSIVSGANALGPLAGSAIAVPLGNRAAFVLAGVLLLAAAAVVAWRVPRSS
jgi:DHA1 family multidrug resistance protein-like MFS transporter